MRIGVDLGGTKTEIVALGDDGRECLRERVPTPRGDYAATVQTIVDLVRRTEAALGQTGTLGVGIPGAESRVTGLVKNANSTWLIGRPFRTDLQQALAREVRIDNDANCFALSEAVDGAAAGADVVFGVILGTGVGGGIVVHGQTLRGANAIAGEWGHNPMPGEQNQLPCYCGHSDCIELFLSGPGMAREQKLSRGGTALDALAIAQHAEADDAECAAVLARYEARLARALAGVINILDPDVIVLGGGLSNIDRLYRHVPTLWQAHVFSDHVATRLVRNRHGDSSGVRGAAWLWGQ